MRVRACTFCRARDSGVVPPWAWWLVGGGKGEGGWWEKKKNVADPAARRYFNTPPGPTAVKARQPARSPPVNQTRTVPRPRPGGEFDPRVSGAAGRRHC